MDVAVCGQEHLIKGSGCSWYRGMLHVAENASFVMLDNQQAIFSEANQQIYALNETAAAIWCRLEERQSPPAIVDEIAGLGINPRMAEAFVHRAIDAWLRLGLLKFNCDLERESTRPWHSFAVEIGGLSFVVRAASESLARRLIPLFGDGFITADSCDNIFHLVRTGRLIHVFQNQLNVMSCTDAELAPSFKTYITEQILARSKHTVVFHAACLVRDDRYTLISGAPGAGKTTLALHLMKAGFKYRSDDIAVIGPTGNVRGLPFAPTIKSGAWDIVGKLYPELNGIPIHHRPDGKRVRYLTPPHMAPDRSYPVAQIVFIQRHPDAAANLKLLSRVEALSRLVEGSYSPSNRLSREAFGAIKHILINANSFDLTYSNATQACDAIVDLADA